MAKARDAFRTISEVSEVLDTPAHVLRFWESKFTQVKPVKRAGGRRYYRPEDVTLLGGIKTLLHDQGMTIKAVQALLRSEGVKHVQSLSSPLSEIEMGDVVEHRSAAGASESLGAGPVDNVVPLQTRQRDVPASPEKTEPADAAISAHDQSRDKAKTDDSVAFGTEMPPPTPITPDSDAPVPTAERQDASLRHDVEPEPVATAMPPPTAIPAGSEAETKSDTATDDAPSQPETPSLPDLIETDAEGPGPRFFDQWKATKDAHVMARADRIAPLVQRLESLRDRMRHAS